MIKHIVMWKLSECEEKQANIEKMKALLEGLEDKIEEVVKIEVGTDLISSPGELDIILYSEFKSFKDLDTYAMHPEHLKVGDFIKSVVESRSAVDYEV